MTFGSRSCDAAVQIVPYDPMWPLLFEREQQMLARVLAPWLTGPIEHVGSTAVLGLAAKPVIDIMAGVRNLDDSRPAIEALTAPDMANDAYRHAPYKPDVMHWFCKPTPEFRTHHLHLVPVGSRMWIDKLAFRDYLRRNSDTAAAYAELKQRLAAGHRHDREAYTEAKGTFIREVLARA